MRRRGRLLFGLLVLLPLALPAAPLVRDLGEGLEYVRIRELPADLPAQPKGAPPACVVDVRYLAAGPEVTAAFAAWLKFRAAPRSPVLVLANRESSAELRRALRAPHQGTGIAVIGIPGPDFEPDIPVRAPAENERAAYDALKPDTPLDALLADHPGKVRHDEARLSRPLAAPVDPPPPVNPRAVPIDAALQRAVHFHRSLRALRRI